MTAPDPEAEALSQAVSNVAQAASGVVRGARKVSGSSGSDDVTVVVDADDWAALVESIETWNQAGETFVQSVRKRAAGEST